MINVDIKDLISETYYHAHRDIRQEMHRYYLFKGGRSSLKSSLFSIEITLGIMEDPEANAIIFRQVYNTVEDSVYNQIGWAIDKLGVSHLFKPVKSPYRYIYKPTGQVIMFKGLDNELKLKSIKPRKGYFRYAWFEELQEYAGPKTIRSVINSVRRGAPIGKRCIVFMSFNPPKNKNSWVNQYYDEMGLNPNVYRLHTDYRTAPVEWIGQDFIDEAEFLRKTDYEAYLNELLGLCVGTGLLVFPNIEVREITDEEIRNCCNPRNGMDFGFNDPTVFVHTEYQPGQNRILITDGMYKRHLQNSQIADNIIDKGYQDERIICDSASPDKIADLYDAGLKKVTGAKKGSNSRWDGAMWLRKRKIVVDPERTPEIYKELINLSYVLDKDGNPLDEISGVNDHSFDALNYAYSEERRRKGSTA